MKDDFFFTQLVFEGEIHQQCWQVQQVELIIAKDEQTIAFVPFKMFGNIAQHLLGWHNLEQPEGRILDMPSGDFHFNALVGKCAGQGIDILTFFVCDQT